MMINEMIISNGGLHATANSSSEISETSLREIGKNVGQYVRKNLSASKTSMEDVDNFLFKILNTASSPTISTTHGAAACNALSAFFDWAIRKGDPDVRALVFSEATFRAGLEAYFQKAETVKAKPLKQLLSSLLSLISRNPNTEVQKLLKTFAVLEAITSIYSRGDISVVKSSMQILEFMLQQSLVSSCDVFATWRDISSARDDSRLGDGNDASLYSDEYQSAREFIFACLEFLSYPNVASVVSRLVSSLIAFSQTGTITGNEKGIEVQYNGLHWFDTIKGRLVTRPDLFDAFEENVLPALLKSNILSRRDIIKALNLQMIEHGDLQNLDHAEIHLALICIRHLIRYDTGKSTLEGEDDLDIQPELIASTLLIHQSSNIRLAAFSLAAAPTTKLTPISIPILEAFRHAIPCYHNEVDPEFRQEFVAVLKQMWTRLCLIIRRLQRKHEQHLASVDHAQSPPSKECCKEQGAVLSAHTNFMRWYISFLCEELQPTAAYQRHIVALSMLQFCISSDIREAAIPFHSKTIDLAPLLERLLLDLATDPFDDVRSISTYLLRSGYDTSLFQHDALNMRKSSGPNGKNSKESKLLEILAKAEARMQATGRADHADGVGRLYAVVFDTTKSSSGGEWQDKQVSIVSHLFAKIQADIATGSNDLRRAMVPAPFHGHVIALRYIFDSRKSGEALQAGLASSTDIWRRFTGNAIDLCEESWEAVRKVLCVDTPEGATIDEDAQINDKDALSFSWRTLKESSLLLQATMASDGSLGIGLDSGDFERIGNLAVTQLAELRHRGAFSTVSQTFAACCMHCSRSQDSDIRSLPRAWYNRALALIKEKSSALTRRSAGLPAMIVGILATANENERFEDIFLNLQRLASAPIEPQSCEENRLPQVHALNCLKDAFTDNRIASLSEAYAAESLGIAARCLDSELWPIRNSGLMLFKALLTRLNKGAAFTASRPLSRGRRSSLFYRKYPKMAYLVGMLLQLTSSGYGTNDFDHAEVKESQTTNTQRVFAALEVLQTFGLPDESRTKLLDSLWRHVISPSWPIREKAAATLCSVLTSSELEDLEIKLLKSNWASNNELHGRILCLRILDSEDGVSDARPPRLAYGTGPLRDVLKEMSASDEQTEKYKEKEAMWIRWLIVVTGDFRDNIRVTGVNTIQDYLQALLSLPSSHIRPSPRLYICLYDFLIDDDQDVREAAAKATSILLSNESLGLPTMISQKQCYSLDPTAAASELLNAIAQVHQTSIIVWLEAIRRLTAVDDSMSGRARLLSLPSTLAGEIGPFDENVSSLPPTLRSFEEMLLSTKEMDDETFAVEKQNLYTDETQEARRWANVLSRLRPDVQVHAKAAKVISWIHEGLAVLISELETSSTPRPVDWIAEPDATTLVIRLALTTKVQAHWCHHAISVDAGALGHSQQQWERVAKIGAKRLHPLTQLEIQRSVLN